MSKKKRPKKPQKSTNFQPLTGNSAAEPRRLQRFLAEAGIASRRAAEQLIQDGRVKVNEKVVLVPGSKVTPGVDQVFVDGKRVGVQAKHLYLYHKPPGVLSTLDDPFSRPCIGDAVRDLPVRVFPVGRLDFDVFGLLLLTNDGEFANNLLHPRYETPRNYLAEVKGLISNRALQRLTRGILLEDGMGRALTASDGSRNPYVKSFGTLKEDHSVVDLSVGEGRNHFVKRLLAAAGHPVRRLCRYSFGPYELGELKRGEIKEISFSSSSSTKTA